MIAYGQEPRDLGSYTLEPTEMMFYLYLPIIMPGDAGIHIPDRLRFLDRLTIAVIQDIREHLGEPAWKKHYVYITAKTMWVEPGNPGNRPGWHADGFGSDGDLNYIWHDMNPTEFCVQDFENVPTDDAGMLEAIESAVDMRNIRIYPNGHLLRLDESVIHRVSPVINPGVRTFIKYSVSKHKYNLVGNSHNHLILYDWIMYKRAEDRNCDNKDFNTGV